MYNGPPAHSSDVRVTNDQTLRVHVSRLRRRISPLGLAITSVRNVGYVMHEHSMVLVGEPT